MIYRVLSEQLSFLAFFLSEYRLPHLTNSISFYHKIFFNIVLLPFFTTMMHFSRYLFFTDQGTRSVERTNLDGSNRRVISNEDVYWPNQITVDYRTQ